MNLVINASEAIGDRSGFITISTGSQECTESDLQDAWLTDPIPEGTYVFLEVTDNGCGMDSDTLAKIFDPFFTTKFTGRGLGMAAVLGIIRGHKGTIKVSSEPGKGSHFKVLLPAVQQPAELYNDHPVDNELSVSGVALLVDDEEAVRQVGTEMLRSLGLQVLTANDGKESLEIYRSRSDIAFVILDLTMPHMDGIQCFHELRQINPHVKVIMSSGYNEQEVTQKFVGKDLAGFIQKPYKLSTLREVIRAL
jgi:CheY-like chemotaxis protein